MFIKAIAKTGLLVALMVKAPGAEAQITLSEIQAHNSEADCWTAVYGEVYDVTAYAPNHPVGAAVLVAGMCGKDGTTSFDQVHGDTPNYMTTFPGITRLGTLAADTPAPVATPLPTPSPTNAPVATSAPAPPTPMPTNAPVAGAPSPVMMPTLNSDSESSDSDSDDRKMLRG